MTENTSFLHDFMSLRPIGDLGKFVLQIDKS